MGASRTSPSAFRLCFPHEQFEKAMTLLKAVTILSKTYGLPVWGLSHSNGFIMYMKTEREVVCKLPPLLPLKRKWEL